MIANDIKRDAGKSVSAQGSECADPIVREFSEHEREEWDVFVRSAPNGHVMQGWSWGEYKSKLGFIVVRLAVLRDDTIVAAAQMLIRKAFGIAIAYVPRGPVCPSDDERSYEILVDALHQQARRHRSFFLRVEPNEPPTSSVDNVLRKNGFLPSPVDSFPSQPLVTLMVDLSGGSEAVMARMKKRTRNYVRSTSRRLHVRRAASAGDLETFHALIQDVADREKFDTRPISYYRALLDELEHRDEAALLFVEHEGEVLAGQLVVVLGEEGIALYNGRSSRHRNIPANQLLEWKSMEWCMERGCTRYDLYGVFESKEFHHRNDPSRLLTEDDIEPEMRGLFRYKSGFGSEPVRYIGPHDYPYHRYLYSLWWKTSTWHLRGTDRWQSLRNRVEIMLRQMSR